MKQLFFLKLLVFIFTTLIILGMALVIFKIAEKKSNNKSEFTTSSNGIFLSEGEQIRQMIPCGERVCLLISTTQSEKIMVLDPENGQVRLQIPVVYIKK